MQRLIFLPQTYNKDCQNGAGGWEGAHADAHASGEMQEEKSTM